MLPPPEGEPSNPLPAPMTYELASGINPSFDAKFPVNVGPSKRRRSTLQRIGVPWMLSLLGLLMGWASVYAQEDPTASVTFRNPVPVFTGNFGQSIAALGSDRVLIGEWGNSLGGAYLFSDDGTLLKKFPSRGEGFGWSVAAVGTDRILIGAPVDPGGRACRRRAFVGRRYRGDGRRKTGGGGSPPLSKRRHVGQDLHQPPT